MIIDHLLSMFKRLQSLTYICNKVKMVFIKNVDIFIIYIIVSVIFYIMKQAENMPQSSQEHQYYIKIICTYI